jgi:hypothetical protein
MSTKASTIRETALWLQPGLLAPTALGRAGHG